MRRSRDGIEVQSGSGRSIEWQQRDSVWRSTLRTRDKLVLLAFLDFDREAEGKVLWPSLELVARMTGLSYSSVHEAVKALREGGVLEPVGYVSSRYRLRGRVVKYLFNADRLNTVSHDTLQRAESVDSDRVHRAESVERNGVQPSESDLPLAYRHAPKQFRTDSNLGSDKLQIEASQTPAAGDKRIERSERSELRTAASPPHAADLLEDDELRLGVLAEMRTRHGGSR